MSYVSRAAARWQQGTLYDVFAPALTRLAGSVGAGGANRRGDNAKVQALLARTRHLDLARTDGPTGYGLFTLDNAIQAFQRDHGLKIDGRVDPGGPTLAKLAEAAKLRRPEAPTLFPASSRPAPAPLRWAGAASYFLTRKRFIEPPAPRKTARIGMSTRRVEPRVQVAQPQTSPPTRLTYAFGRKFSPDDRPTMLHPFPIGAPVCQLNVPAYRQHVFGSRPHEWGEWHLAVGELSLGTQSENRPYLEIFAAEGGKKADGGTVAGIEKETLKSMEQRGKLSALPSGKLPKDLNIWQIAAVYRDYFNDVLGTVGGSEALGKFADERAAAAFADAMFKDGRGAGALNIQKAINDLAPGRVPEDGQMGPQTFAAYRFMASTNPSRLLDALADRRIEHVEITKKGPNVIEGLTKRIDHFRLHNMEAPRSQ